MGGKLGDEIVGFVRVRSPDGLRHAYGVGQVPAGELSAELGALSTEPGPNRVPLRLTEEGRLIVGTEARRPPPRSRRALLRWVLAPLRWGGRSRFAVTASRLGRPAACCAPSSTLPVP